MSEVIEQSATRWLRPGDYGPRSGAPHFDNKVPSKDRRKPGSPRYERQKRGPVVPNRKPAGMSPADWRRLKNGRPPKNAPPANDFINAPKNPPGMITVPSVPYTGTSFRGLPIGTLVRLVFRDPRARLLADLGQLVVPELYGTITGAPGVFAEPQLRPDQLYDPVTNPGGRWIKMQDCGADGPFNAITKKGMLCLNNPSTNCLSGQAGEWGPVDSSYILPTDTFFAIGEGTYNSNHDQRATHKVWYRKTRPAGTSCDTTVEDRPILRIQVLPRIDATLNPNLRRALPSIRPRAEAQAGAGLAPVPPGQTPQFAFEAVGGGVKPRRIPVSGRNPPRRREHEGKVFSNSTRVGIALAKALDKISESAEVVDSFFRALPPSVQKQWENRYDQDRGLLDQAGQYGIDGADWKLRALYENWHKVNFEKAISNVIANEVEDQAYGRAYRGIRQGGIRQPI